MDKNDDYDFSFCLVTGREFVDDKDFFSVLEKSLQSGVTLVQLREKTGRLTDRQIYETGLQVVSLCRKYHCPVVVDDRLDLAMAIGADGLHVGQTDLPIPVARKLWPQGRIFGLSVASLEQALEGQLQKADYLGVGAYPTATKADCPILGVQRISEIAHHCSLPLMAIGGVNADNIPFLIHAGCKGIAVVSAVWKAQDPGREALKISQAVKETFKEEGK